MLEYDEAVAFLQRTHSTEGTSVYSHLSKIVQEVLEKKPVEAVDILETSLVLKRHSLRPSDVSPPLSLTCSSGAAKAQANVSLFGAPDLPIDPNSGEAVELEAPNEYECQDILSDARLFSSLGVGLGWRETYNVLLIMKKLGESPQRQIATVRFFGKFLGIYADYYVLETTLQNPPSEPEQLQEEGEAPMEWNSGGNANVYYVCNHVGGPLTQLPPVTPKQIKAARHIKKFLTGRLSSHVSSYPVFPGNEANLLRAQTAHIAASTECCVAYIVHSQSGICIARIAASTECCPNGMFAVDEEGEVQKAEEFEPLGALEMTALANWSHKSQHLKKQGRCQLHVPEPPDGEDGEEAHEPTEEEQEEGPEQFATLDNDAHLEDGSFAWTQMLSSTSELLKHQVAGMRSNLWPGAVSVAQGKGFANLYVGWGVKNARFMPLPPPPVSKEFDQKLVETAELPPKKKAGEDEE